MELPDDSEVRNVRHAAREVHRPQVRASGDQGSHLALNLLLFFRMWMCTLNKTY